MALADPIEQSILTTADLDLASSRPPMVIGGTFQGTGAQLTIWATEYNRHIAAKRTPRYAARKAARRMLVTCTMHDLGQLGYYTAVADDPGSPPGFGFNPGQLFPLPSGGPIPPSVFTGLQLAISIISEIPSAYAQILAAALELIEIILDIVDYIAQLFAGKPTFVDTQTVAQRFLSGQNPAAFVPGIQLLRNMSQNGIYLSSSDPQAQTILGNIRRQAEEMIVAQGELDEIDAKQLITLVWDSANDPSFVLPAYLKKPPPAPPPPPPPTCPAGQVWDPTTQQCVPIGTPTQGPCPPYTQLPSCLPAPPPPGAESDEIGDGFAALSYWLMIIAVYLMNLFQLGAAGSGSGSGGGSGGGSGCNVNVTVEPAAVTIEPIPAPPAPVVNVTVEPAPVTIAPGAVDLSHLNAAADQQVGDAELAAANHGAINSKTASDYAQLAQGLQ